MARRGAAGLGLAGLGKARQARRGYAGAKYYYRGRRRVTDMTLPEAEQRVAEALKYADAWKAGHSHKEADGYVSTDWHGYVGLLAPRDIEGARDDLVELAEQRQLIAGLKHAISEAEQRYTGWSRFFLVTSSAGHVHSSMHCSTCRLTTTYGWLPELSGQSETEAVAKLGPNLCSVCFPSAPVDHVGGKLTKAQAAKFAA
jgi:hypothetical protein